MKRRPLPWQGWSLKAVALRFFMAALFGLVGDVIIAFLVIMAFWRFAVAEEIAWRVFGWALVGFPVACGALGIVFFERMTTFFRDWGS